VAGVRQFPCTCPLGPGFPQAGRRDGLDGPRGEEVLAEVNWAQTQMEASWRFRSPRSGCWWPGAGGSRAVMLAQVSSSMCQVPRPAAGLARKPPLAGPESMTNHTRQLDRAKFDGRLRACDLPLNKARPAQTHLTGPRCVSRDTDQGTSCRPTLHNVHYRQLSGTSCIRCKNSCPVTGNMSFDSHLVVSHVVVTAIILSALCDSLRHHAGGRSQSTPPQRAVSRSAAAAASAAPSRDTYAFVRGNVRSDM
jgi:hypothetical protein